MTCSCPPLGSRPSRLLIATLAAALAGAGGLAPSEADAAPVLCQKTKNQKLKVREDACKEGKEKLIDLDLSSIEDALLAADGLQSALDEVGADADANEESIADLLDALQELEDEVADLGDVGRTIVIPGDLSDSENCDAVKTAIEQIADNSAETPYLVKLGPGVYDCGEEGIDLKPWVDLEGSGRNVTRVLSTECGTILRHTITLADETEVRSVYAENACDDGTAHGAIGSGDPIANATVSDVIAVSTGRGIIVTSADGVLIRDTEISAASVGISVPNSTGVFASLELDGVVVRDADPYLSVSFETETTIRNSMLPGVISGTGGPDSVFNVIASQIGSPGASNTFRCVAAYDTNFEQLGSECDEKM